MPVSRLAHVVAQLSPPDDVRPDADLLSVFLSTRDERAFAALILRHSPGVRAVCRGWLRQQADVDDATQATFVVFLRRAGTIRDRAAVGRWLYRTAGFVARKLKARVNRAGPLPDDVPERPPGRRFDERAAVTAEIGLLPEPYRLALQLHYEVGLTAAAVADRLCCPRSTVLTRLARGRDLLRRRLTARGIAPAVALTPVGSGLVNSSAWASSVARSALAQVFGGARDALPLSPRSVSLSEGVIRTMFWKKIQVLAVAAMIATGFGAFLLGQWASADSPKKAGDAATAGAAPGRPGQKDSDEPPVPSVRREAVIRMPVGTFVKEFEVPPYGSGRITWTYENDRVRGHIALEVDFGGMGAAADLTTEAEISMASTGTIYGVLTGFKVNQIKLPAEMKAEWGGLDVAKAWPLVEPLVNDVMTDLPFSYSFRLAGDRLTIQNYRLLLAGPNPLGKLGGLAAGGNEAFMILAYFQAIGTAIEGTYTLTDPEKDAPLKKPAAAKPSVNPSRKIK